MSSLYRIKRLKDVIVVMENQYQFFATERMYKARFKEWGLKKNVTTTEVHKLMEKVEEERQRRRNLPASGARAANERVVLDVGEDLDVKRIQKYMKRKPVGLGKLRPASRKSLEVLKALSIDSGKGASGGGRVSIPVVKLEQQTQQKKPDLPPRNFVPWCSPGAEVPDEIFRLLQSFIDNHFDCPYPLTPTPSATPTPLTCHRWQPESKNHSNLVDVASAPFWEASSQDEIMLDFVLKIRVAHILLDDGLTSEGMQAINTCLDSVAFCIQEAQNTSPMDTRPATSVILWALSAALDIISDFENIKQLIMHMLFQRIAASCAGYQPTMAKLANQISQIEVYGQVVMLRHARYSISRALFAGHTECQPAFETYARTVDISESLLSPGDKFQALCTLAKDSTVHAWPLLDAWMETRIALSVSDASSPDRESFGSHGTSMSPSRYTRGNNKVAAVLGLMAGNIEWHRAVGNWKLVQQVERRYESIAQTARGYIGEAARGSGEELEFPKPPSQVARALTLMEPSMSRMALPEVTFKMSHQMGEIPDWGQQQQQQQVQVAPRYESLSDSGWIAAETSRWQVDASFGSDYRMYSNAY
ncbi:hypothetical protein N8I77_005078 [Diaporthe amygdali]|uniref:Clr5 domain-containing protein n=1 Tax=Phomopsis amygdali TaxID=1214568 RepID=A0AAD9W6K0_PHOAM|nr:hypothetical protein N8I77_005078 [Diaporthe amygdali]